MCSLARRIVDPRVLHLIKMWLECAVEETDDRGRKTRSTEAKDKQRGIPQGSPISPLMANIYMRRFVMAWKKRGLEKILGTRIVTYADDLVILCRPGNAEEALTRMREIMGKLKLTVNEEKTRICRISEDEFDFLGYTFRWLRTKHKVRRRGGGSYPPATTVWALRTHPPYPTRSRPVVGEGVKFCPRAGCGKSASPVR